MAGRLEWWEGSYYADAGEVAGWGVVEGSAERAALARYRARRGSEDAPESALLVEFRDDSKERAERRVRSKLRRYCAANKLDRLIVLTFAEPEFDLKRAQARARLFVKRGLRPLIKDGPYLIGWERHKSGAWHVNLAVSRYVRHGALRDAWGRGHVWVSKFRSRQSGREAAREVGRYIAKYVSKDLQGMGAGGHRYEVGQGFAPSAVRVYGASFRSLLGEIEREVGKAQFVWRAPLGTGPPIGFASF